MTYMLRYNILLPLIVLLVGACTSTTLTRVWKDDEFTSNPLKRIMVLGIAEKQASEQLVKAVIDQLKADGLI